MSRALDAYPVHHQQLCQHHDTFVRLQITMGASCPHVSLRSLHFPPHGFDETSFQEDSASATRRNHHFSAHSHVHRMRNLHLTTSARPLINRLNRPRGAHTRAHIGGTRRGVEIPPFVASPSRWSIGRQTPQDASTHMQVSECVFCFLYTSHSSGTADPLPTSLSGGSESSSHAHIDHPRSLYAYSMIAASLLPRLHGGDVVESCTTSTSEVTAATTSLSPAAIISRPYNNGASCTRRLSSDLTEQVNNRCRRHNVYRVQFHDDTTKKT